MLITPFPFKAVLWDLDGTLADTGEAHYLAWSATMRELQIPYSHADFLRSFGMNNRLTLELFLGDAFEESYAEQIGNRKEILFRRLIPDHVRLFPGALDCITFFAARSCKQVIASSAPQANITALVDGLNLADRFDAVFSGEQTPSKPDPAIFLLAANSLRIAPVDCLVLEDSPAGVLAAKSAGMTCYAVTSTHPAEGLKKADRIISDLSQIPALFS